MANSKKCPICGREGISDYLKADVTCPECGSNLRAFRIIEQLEQDANSKTSNWKPFGIVATVAAIVFALLYFTKGSMPTADKEKLSILEDSIATLNEMIKDGNGSGAVGNVVATTSVIPAAKETKQKETQQKETVKKEEQKTETASNTATTTTTEKAAEEVKETPAPQNGITAPDNMVTVKNGKKYYTVKKGDSWWKISGKLYNHKISDGELAKMNGKNKNTPIDVGQQILVK